MKKREQLDVENCRQHSRQAKKCLLESSE